MLQILQVLHEEGISHLDLSPENFMLRQNKDGNIDLLVIDLVMLRRNFLVLQDAKGSVYIMHQRFGNMNSLQI